MQLFMLTKRKEGLNMKNHPSLSVFVFVLSHAGAKDLTGVEFLYLFLGANYDYFRRHFFSTSFSGMVAF